MSLKKLNEKANEYSLSEDVIKKKENDRLSFVEKFPLENLKNLSIDQFVQGTDDNSFCYWLEFKKIGFGIGGGNASKFGLYKTNPDGIPLYVVGSGKSKKYISGNELEEVFSNLKQSIIQALIYAKTDQINKIKELNIPMWNMVLQKILAIYYPDKFLTIGSPTVLIKCAKELEIQNTELSPDNSIQINYECKKAISKNPQFVNWSYEKIGKFIWETFNGEDKAKEKKETKQYWLYSPGENARNWEEFYNGGIMALGWDEIGDLTKYTSRIQIKKALVDAYGGDSSKSNDVSANDDFLNKVSIGDIIIAKKGRGELLGYGVVISDYSFDKNRNEYLHTRKVDWKLKGNWKVDFSLVLKTLTDITKYSTEHPDYETYFERLLGIMGMGNSKNSYKEVPLNVKVIYAYLKKSLSHRKIQAEILKEDAPARGGGFLAMEILHGYEIEGDKKGILNRTSFKKEYDKATGRYLDALDLLKTHYSEFGKVTIQTKEMNYPLNTIFYGPPGTGKTYKTILRAAQIIENQAINSYKEALAVFKANLREKIEFITFHQNYSYEDFIQGLRPDTENDNQLTFERKDGVFKAIADKALKNLIESEKPQVIKKPFEEVFNQFINPLIEGETEEIEVKMKKVSYFITAISNKSIDFRKASGGTAHTLSIGTLKKMYLAESVLEIQGLASYYNPLLNQLLKLGKDSSGKKERIKRQDYVIIIDEINRANISRVFGELITLIEPDKRSHGAIPLEARLPSGDKFLVPSNLYIIGTMNTADKSIALLDIALRRRFEFESMYPKYEIENEEIYDTDILFKINEQIIKTKGHDFQIGHAYFMGENKDLVQRMNKKVIPLLLEYYMNDEKEVKGILQSAGLAIEDGAWPIKITGLNG